MALFIPVVNVPRHTLLRILQYYFLGPPYRVNSSCEDTPNDLTRRCKHGLVALASTVYFEVIIAVML